MLFLIVRQLSRQHHASRQRLTLEKERLDAAVNNMSQGLLLFDRSERLVICNQRYIAMYGLSGDVIKPGPPASKASICAPVILWNLLKPFPKLTHESNYHIPLLSGRELRGSR